MLINVPLYLPLHVIGKTGGRLMLSIEEKILTLNTLRLLPVAAIRFTFYALRFLPVPCVPRAALTSIFILSNSVPIYICMYVCMFVRNYVKR